MSSESGIEGTRIGEALPSSFLKRRRLPGGGNAPTRPLAKDQHVRKLSNMCKNISRIRRHDSMRLMIIQGGANQWFSSEALVAWEPCSVQFLYPSARRRSQGTK